MSSPVSKAQDSAVPRHRWGARVGGQQLTRAAWYITQVDRAVLAAPEVRNQEVDCASRARVYLLRASISVDRLSRLSDFRGFKVHFVDRLPRRNLAKTLHYAPILL